jgi:hypothetical protein
MQNGSPDAHGALVCEFRFGQDCPVGEANASKDLPLAGLNMDAQFAERRECARQKPFATRFISAGLAPSATVTEKPFFRAAIAAASPAGSPPMTNTSVAFRMEFPSGTGRNLA